MTPLSFARVFLIVGFGCVLAAALAFDHGHFGLSVLLGLSAIAFNVHAAAASLTHVLLNLHQDVVDEIYSLRGTVPANDSPKSPAASPEGKE